MLTLRKRRKPILSNRKELKEHKENARPQSESSPYLCIANAKSFRVPRTFFFPGASASLRLTRNPKLIGAIWHNLLAASAIRQAAPYLLIRRRLPQGISAQHLAPSHPLQHRNSGLSFPSVAAPPRQVLCG
jgi:hypothetical protein